MSIAVGLGEFIFARFLRRNGAMAIVLRVLFVETIASVLEFVVGTSIVLKPTGL